MAWSTFLLSLKKLLTLRAIAAFSLLAFLCPIQAFAEQEFGAPFMPFNAGPGSVATADMNGDGDLDLVELARTESSKIPLSLRTMFR